MELQEFMQKFAEQCEDKNGIELSSKKKFREIEGWSSFTALTIIAMVDDQYKVKLKAVDIRQSETIEDLYYIVKARM